MSSKFENISIPSIKTSTEKESQIDIRLQVPLISRSSSNIKSKSSTDYAVSWVYFTYSIWINYYKCCILHNIFGSNEMER